MRVLLDKVISIFALLCLCPVLVVTAFLIYVKLGSPILFCQIRPGLYGKPFTLIKFRTMSEKKDANGNVLEDRDRLSRFGQILRSLSIDELPTFYNVLRGDMSLIGPRPLLMEYLDLYTDVQARRNEVRPGITGWAQVNGRNELSWEDKFCLDVWYVDNRSVWIDISIVFKTVRKVFAREGVTAKNHATIQRFTGNKD